jgi:outer membrane receptor protein involved in Fe transport
VGLYAQPPSAQQSSSAINAAFGSQPLGNPNLLPQRAMHYALGIEEQFPALPTAPWLSHLSASVEGFYKQLDSLVISTPSYLQRSVPPAPPYSNNASGQVYGMEVLLRYRPDARFFGWVAYTLSRATRTDAPGQSEHLYVYDQTHILTVLGSYRIGAGFEVGLRFRYVTGSLTTPVIGSFYDTASLRYIPVYGAVNSERLPDFLQLDLRVDKTFRIGPRANIGLFLEILNLFNYANVEGYQYNFDYTQRVPINGIPFFPNLGLRGEY